MYGKRIKNLRESVGLSQLEFGNALGDKYGEEYRFTQNAISKYEKEQREPRTDVFVKIADFFGVSTDYLFGIETDKSPPDNQIREALYQKLMLLDDDTIQQVIDYVKYLIWREKQG